MFPTLVWRAELTADARAAINADVLRALAGMHEPRRPRRLDVAWQSRHDLQHSAPFANLIACVRAAAIEVLDFLKIRQEEIAVTGCWVNVLPPGRAHRAHSHPNNFLSGVYYVSTRPGADTVNFHDPRPQTCIIRPPVTALTADNTDQVVFKVKDGTLLLFPAWLEHSVDDNRSGEERISVSFNIMFRSYSDLMSAPMW
ncbi:MAG: 2OG-Fe(II) oxygenase family protein [Alphaproteobacteria bacterium]